MADKTSIEWTRGDDGTPGASWNPIRARDRGPVGTGPGIGTHCEIITPGCEHCYAQAINKRLGTHRPYLRTARDKVHIYLDEKTLTQPLHWKRPRRIFVCSMSDLFGEWVPDEMIDRVFAVMATAGKARGHVFQVLTKRAERMRAYLERIDIGSVGAIERFMSTDHYQAGVRARAEMPVDNRLSEPPRPTPQLRHLYDLAPMKLDFSSRGASGEYHWQKWPLDSVWLGVSVEDQRRADERIPELLMTPAAVHWVSAEPLLGPINFKNIGEHDVTEGNGQIKMRAHGIDAFWKTTLRPRINWMIIGGESGPRARPFRIEWARAIIAQCKAADVPCFMKQVGAVPIIEDIEPFNGGFPDGTHFGNRTGIKSLNGRQALLRDRKGADPAEWPEDLRVREYPKTKNKEAGRFRLTNVTARRDGLGSARRGTAW